MSIVHPGPYVKTKIFPPKMSVSDAATKLGISRPALSRFLNGKAALSPELARKLEEFFGCSATDLLRLQADYDASGTKSETHSEPVGQHVPPYLKILSTDIEAWANTIPARTQLPVLLRILVHSTGIELEKVDFPGNNDGERHGWDGEIEAKKATPWIPNGNSVWEFGCNKSPEKKAKSDYEKRTTETDLGARKNLHYTVVTPRRWPGKSAWQKAKNAQKVWKSVRVFDASDLEQWVEQSIPAQIYFAAVTGKHADGTKSLDDCRQEWQADCQPALGEELFSQALVSAQSRISDWASRQEAELLRIEADSVIEGLAFVDQTVDQIDGNSHASFRDRCVVFTSPDLLKTVLTENTRIIPILPDRDTQAAFAPFHRQVRAIAISNRQAGSSEADITLDLLSHDAFRQALESMGLERHEIDRLDRESGRSVTVLRRRLSSIDAVRAPRWATDEAKARALMPMAFAGAWDARVDIDLDVLEGLSPALKYVELERQFSGLQKLDDTPVWSAGSFRGVVSRIDALFAIQAHVTKPDLDRFFELAEFVLSEEDPSIELPENQRYLAGMKGKTRHISSALRRGIRDMLTLLSIYGNALFKDRTGVDCEARASTIVRRLITPLDTQILEGHSRDLPAYAEISPTAFLKAVEDDLADESNSECLKLMRPASTGFGGGCPRTGLLWALENLAWMPSHLARVTDILGRLARVEIDDNWVNKPIESLHCIFRAWMPQTSADVDSRIQVLDRLANQHPEAAWTICTAQFDPMKTVGNYNHKLEWRTDGQGAGEPVSGQERHQFVIHAVNTALDWSELDKTKLGDLIRTSHMLGSEFQERLWKRVEEWVGSGVGEDDKAWLREKLRTNVLSLRAAKRDKKRDAETFDPARVRAIYELLEPESLIYRHLWLFKQDWIEPSAEELDEEEFDYEGRQAWIKGKRETAFDEIYSKHGVKGLLDLAHIVEARSQIGRLIAEYLANKEDISKIVLDVIGAGTELDDFQKDLLFGLIRSQEQKAATTLLNRLRKALSDSLFDQVLLLSRFDHSTWQIVETLPTDRAKAYWASVSPRLFHDQASEVNYVVQKLLDHGRPIAAFHAVQHQLEQVSASLISKILEEAVSSSEHGAQSHRMEQYYVEAAFRRLEDSDEFSDDHIANLEYRFLGHLVQSERGIPYLEREVSKNPELFADFVAFLYKRTDGGEDPEKLRVRPEQAEVRADFAYHLLDGLKQLPGENSAGELEAARLIEWIKAVQVNCKALARVDIGDSQIGKLLSQAPAGEDSVWPCEQVREALESTGTSAMFEGFRVGKYNSRGVVMRGEGGDQERELEHDYRTWASSMEYSYPRVAGLLHEIANGYRQDAEFHDTEAVVRRRLPY